MNHLFCQSHVKLKRKQNRFFIQIHESVQSDTRSFLVVSMTDTERIFEVKDAVVLVDTVKKFEQRHVMLRNVGGGIQ